MIDTLNKFLAKKHDILGLYDLAEITKNPQRVYQILKSHRRDEFLPNHVIAFYTQHIVKDDLLKHLLDATLLIDVDPSFIMLCGPKNLGDQIANVCVDFNNFKFTAFKVSSDPLENNYVLPETFCPIPWISMEVRENGNISPCCMTTKDTVIGNIKDGIQTAFHSERMNSMRQEFLDGGKPKDCNSCWAREERGLITNRLRHRSYLLKDLLVTGLDNPTISQLDLKFGKTCNFKCRICSPASSSAFAEEDARFKGIKFVIERNWADNPNHMAELIELLPTLSNIDMFGGEPWLLKSFAKFLKTAVEQGHAKNIRLHYNTNGSIYPKELIQYWPEFREVDIYFSVDAINERFAFERGSTWDAVEANILRIKELNLPNVKLAVMPAISIMNVFYIDEVLSWANGHGFEVNPQHVTVPEAFSLTQLTREAKNMLLEKYGAYQWPEMKKILEHINQTPDSDGKKFVELTRHFDTLRKENFADTHPEIAKAMGYVYNQ
jgi:radical SAM protein with 4Fe4S-binding SPASM domain